MSAVTPKLAPRFPQSKRALTAAPPPWCAWGHLARRLASALALLTADLLIVTFFGFDIELLIERVWLPSTLTDALKLVLPGTELARIQFVIAVILCLILLKAYAPAERGQVKRRRLAAAVLGVATTNWTVLWEAGALGLEAYLVLASSLALALVLGALLVNTLLRLATPVRLRAARVLLVAGHHDIHRARRHPVVSDRSRFAVTAIFDPKGLQGDRALELLCQAMRQCHADTIVLYCGTLCDRAYRVVLDAGTATGCGLISLARSYGGAGSEPRMMWSKGSPMIVLASPAMRAVQLLLKRAVDILGAGFGLVALAPLMLVIAVAVRLQSRGPIVFGHRRVGIRGRPFRCLKFRSMRIDAEELLRRDPVLLSQYVKNNYKLPERSDPRITRLGRILRATSLDELPQLWNVLRGDMSLVGPRPVVPDELSEYGERSQVLLSLKPGVAGSWAVNGRSRVGYPRRAELELDYVRRWRFPLDLTILARTIPAILTRRGAH